MAYMDQSKKAEIKAELKKVVPTGWKWSLSVRHHSTIVLKITKGPAELQTRPAGWVNRNGTKEYEPQPYTDASNWSHFGAMAAIEDYFVGDVKVTMQAIGLALNLGNFDKSETMTDYFFVGHYVSINIGTYDKDFEAIEAPLTCDGAKAAVEAQNAAVETEEDDEAEEISNDDAFEAIQEELEETVLEIEAELNAAQEEPVLDKSIWITEEIEEDRPVMSTADFLEMVDQLQKVSSGWVNFVCEKDSGKVSVIGDELSTLRVYKFALSTYEGVEHSEIEGAALGNYTTSFYAGFKACERSFIFGG